MNEIKEYTERLFEDIKHIDENCKSYFTEKGFEIFKLKTLPIMKKYLDVKLIIIENFEFNIIHNN